jgi:hypothetical protein
MIKHAKNATYGNFQHLTGLATRDFLLKIKINGTPFNRLAQNPRGNLIYTHENDTKAYKKHGKIQIKHATISLSFSHVGL